MAAAPFPRPHAALTTPTAAPHVTQAMPVPNLQPGLRDRVVRDQDALDLTVPTLSAAATPLIAPLETHAARSLMVCALLLVGHGC